MGVMKVLHVSQLGNNSLVVKLGLSVVMSVLTLAHVAVAATVIPESDMANLYVEGSKLLADEGDDTQKAMDTYSAVQLMYANSQYRTFHASNFSGTSAKQVDSLLETYHDLSTGPSTVDGEYALFALSDPTGTAYDVKFKDTLRTAYGLNRNDAAFRLIGDNDYVLERNNVLVELYNVRGEVNIKFISSNPARLSPALGIYPVLNRQ